jgi:hypothetical protein
MKVYLHETYREVQTGKIVSTFPIQNGLQQGGALL